MIRKLTQQDISEIIGTVIKGYTIDKARIKGCGNGINSNNNTNVIDNDNSDSSNNLNSDSDNNNNTNLTDSSNYGILLGRNTGGRYVTWQFHIDDELPDDEKLCVYWGHYHMEDFDGAVSDFNARV